MTAFVTLNEVKSLNTKPIKIRHRTYEQDHLGERLFLIGEVYGYTPSDDLSDNLIEADISLGYKIASKSQLIFGFGKGIRNGMGTPEWRILTGLRI